MAQSITALANITLGSAQSTVTFSGISSAYRDLILISSATMTSGLNTIVKMRFNSDSTNTCSMVFGYGDGSTAASTTGGPDSGIYINGVLGAGTGGYSAIITHILDYVATDKHKTVLSRDASPGTGTEMTAGRWASTSAINTVALIPSATTFAAGSTFALYGVSA